MEPRGKGRGMGRGRGGPGQQRPAQQQRPGPAGPQGAPPQRAPPGPPPQGAWARPPGPAQAWPRPQMGAPPQQPPVQALGRGSHSGEGRVEQVVTGTGDNGGDQGPRGGGNSVRGRVVNRREIIFTRPNDLRTKKGNSGDIVRLQANYLPMISKTRFILIQYRVDLAPDIDDMRQRRRIFRTATQTLITNAYIFDGTVLYVPTRLPNDVTEVFAASDNDENIRVTIKMVGDVQWGDPHYTQVFNLIVRKCLSLMGMQLVGRNYYMPSNRIMIPEHKIMLWPGYTTSMRQHEDKIMLNVDLSFKFLRSDTVYDLLMECSGPNLKKDFQSAVIGSVVLTYYNNRTYRIDDIDFSQTASTTFKKRDGTETSIAQYLKEKYSVNIRTANQPLLVSRSKPREIKAGMPETVLLVPELCYLTGLTDRQRENFTLMRTLAEHTRVGVEGRVKKLYEFAQQINNKPEVVAEIRRWDMQLANRLVEFDGRVLPPEKIKGGGGAEYSGGKEADWTKHMRSTAAWDARKLSKLLLITPSRFKEPSNQFSELLVRCARGMSWDLSTPKILTIPDDRVGTYLDCIESSMNQLKPEMLMVVLSNNSKDRYSAIKKKCYVDRGIPCQCIVQRNLTAKGAMSIATKVAVQMNCKMGGAPWTTNIPLTKAMVVGYDVCRDTANRKKSFSGMVASMDRHWTRYFSQTYEHAMEEELSHNFGAFLVVACKRFHSYNKFYPDRIFIYRDGVGEGQIPYVIDQELESIKNVLNAEIYIGAEKLMLAFIIVSKRINTKIFAGKYNPMPGTVVDDVITLPERYDYFIVSQCVRQGTVAPTNYNVIENTTGLDPDKMQLLTYKLTHMYYNWSGTVRVPAPCQYAHKLAFLVSQSLHRPAHPDLETLLYYL